jgi:hypothetical protein
MIRQRFSTLLTTASLLLIMTAVSAAVPASTLGAIANVQIGGGMPAAPDDPDLYPRAATPTQVSPGNVAGFYLWVKNKDAANLSTFFMNASNANPVGGYFTKNGGAKTDCPIVSKQLSCTFGAFNSGDVLEIVAAFRIPSPVPAFDPNCKPAKAPLDPVAGYRTDPAIASVCVDFAFGSNSGFVLPKKNGNNSRGDEYHWYDFVTTNVGVDAGAGFPFCNFALDPDGVGCDLGLLTVFNSGHASRTDLQTTQVTAPASAFNSLHGSTGLAVHDNLFPAFNCPPTLPATATCATHTGSGADAFVGQWSQVDVNSETQFAEFIRIDLEMYGVNPNTVDGVVHIWQDGTGWHEEVISDPCPTEDGPDASQPGKCFWVSGSGQVTNVSIWTTNNGVYRTF